MQLPRALEPDDSTDAIRLVDCYYNNRLTRPTFTGALFDEWDSTGQRTHNADRFTADDLVSVTFLSVRVGPVAARILLRDRSDEFSSLLAAIGPDRDLAGQQFSVDPSWPAWELDTKLRELPGVGRTIASKLLARKRPRLNPIWDRIVADVFGNQRDHVEPIRLALRADGHALHKRLLGIRDAAGLPANVSAIRILDVIAWMEGTHGDTDRDQVETTD